MNRNRLVTAFVLLWGTLSVAFADDIQMKVHFWIDDMQSSGQTMTLASSDNTSVWESAIDANGLQEGLHQLRYRFQNAKGNWGCVGSWPFLVVKHNLGNTANSVEYWFDEQDADRQTKAISGNKTALALNTPQLSQGIHLLHYRITDTAGNSSAIHSWVFFRQPGEESLTASKVEYWLDNGYNERNCIVLTGNEASFIADASNLAEGPHTLSYRFVDNLNKYSPTESWVFYRLPLTNANDTLKVKWFEYWIDDDVDSCKTIAVNGTHALLNLDISAKSEGMHTLSYRLKDSKGKTGSCKSWLFYKQSYESTDASTKSVCEYWLDDSYNDRNSIVLKDNEASFIADASNLAEGLHTLSYRFVDNLNKYSSTESWLFYRMPLTEANDTLKVKWFEYWIDNEIDSCKTIAVNVSHALLNLDLSAKTEGMHTLSYRLMDSKGKTGSYQTWLFYRQSYTGADAATSYVCEYWLDDGYNNRSQIALKGSEATMLVDASGLPTGIHTLNYRLTDMLGNNSPTESCFFYRVERSGTNSISQCEYWIDQNYEEHKVVSVENNHIFFKVVTNNITDGAHILSFRMLTKDGKSGAISRWLFHKTGIGREKSRYSWCQYWWNDYRFAAKTIDIDYDGDTFVFAQKLVIPEYVQTDCKQTHLPARLNIIFGNEKNEIAPLIYFDIDFLPPSSTIISDKEQANDSITLTWSADSQDVLDYNIYYSEDDQPFVLWLPNTTDTTAKFRGQSGKTYRFTVTARDKAGNRERLDEKKCVTVKFNKAE